MTRDFKQSETTSKNSNAGLFWMLSGIIIGLMAGFAMYYFTNWQPSEDMPRANSSVEVNQKQVTEQQQKPTANNNAENTATANNPGSEATEEKPTKRPNFSYYAVLPNLELDVKVKPRETLDTSTTPNEPDRAPAKGDYLLQLASLNNIQRSERVKKDLARQGINISIQKTTVKGKVWYRILAGPVSTENELAVLKDKVERMNFKPITIKVK